MSTLLSSTAGISRPGNAVTEHETYIPMAFAQNTRDEVRWVNGDGQIAGALAAETGMKQTTYVAQPIPYRKAKRAQTEDDDETWTDDQVANTINLFDQGDIRTTHAVVQPIALAENIIGRQPMNGGNGDGFTEGGPMYTLNATGVHGVVQPIPIDLRNANRDAEKHDEMNRQGVGIGEEGDPSHTLTSACVHGVAQPIAWDEDLNARENIAGTIIRGGDGGRRDGVAHPITFSSVQSAQDINPRSTVSQTLEARNPMAVVAPSLTATNDPSRSPQSSEVTQQVNAVYQASMAVRRLTPVECERLQGFPDDYTRIPWRKGETPDGPRYKALGNSMAVPVMAWIGQRIQAVNDLPK